MWNGIDYNEKLFNGVRNGLVDVYLWGVRGVSPTHGYPATRQLSAAQADAIISKGRALYAKFVAQEPPRSAKAWHDRHVAELDRLISKAVAVRDGGPQKMQASEWADYRKSLNLR